MGGLKYWRNWKLLTPDALSRFWKLLSAQQLQAPKLSGVR